MWAFRFDRDVSPSSLPAIFDALDSDLGP